MNYLTEEEFKIYTSQVKAKEDLKNACAIAIEEVGGKLSLQESVNISLRLKIRGMPVPEISKIMDFSIAEIERFQSTDLINRPELIDDLELDKLTEEKWRIYDANLKATESDYEQYIVAEREEAFKDGFECTYKAEKTELRLTIALKLKKIGMAILEISEITGCEYRRVNEL